MTIWTVAARFRNITISLPEEIFRLRNPTVFTRQLVEVVCLLSTAQEASVDHLTTASTVNIDFGTMFHQPLPFNTASQAYDRTDLDWMYANNYNTTELDFEQMELERVQNLKKLAVAVGMDNSRSKWTIIAATDIDEEDGGGANALVDFQVNCERNAVVFTHNS